MVELWNSEQYEELYLQTKELLSENAFDKTYLKFFGYSSYALGYWQPDENERERFLNDAIISLRRLSLFEKNTISSNYAFILGKAYFHSNQYEKSIEYLEQAQEVDRYNPGINEYLITLYDATTQVGKLESVLDNLYGESKLSEYARARVYMMKKEYARANEAFSKFISKYDSSNRLVYQSIIQQARILYVMEEFDSALDVLHQVTDDNPADISALNLLGDVYLSVGDEQLARFYWREVLTISPENQEAISKLRGT